MNSQTFKIKFENIHNGFLLSALIVSLLVFGIIYIYLINTSVFLVNARQTAEENSSQIEAKLALLETEYIGAQTAIDLPLALSRGFSEAPRDSSFAYRSVTSNHESGLSLSR